MRNKWPRALWLLSESSALLSCSPALACLKGKPICSDVSHNHVDWSVNSTLKAVASLKLAIITVVLRQFAVRKLYFGEGVGRIVRTFCEVNDNLEFVGKVSRDTIEGGVTEDPQRTLG